MSRGYQDSGEYEERLLQRMYGGGAPNQSYVTTNSDIPGGPDKAEYLVDLGIDAQPDPNQFDKGTWVAWFCMPGACWRCIENAEVGAVPYGTMFPSGVTEPPAHDYCGCWLAEVDPLQYKPAPVPPRDPTAMKQYGPHKWHDRKPGKPTLPVTK